MGSLSADIPDPAAAGPLLSITRCRREQFPDSMCPGSRLIQIVSIIVGVSSCKDDLVIYRPGDCKVNITERSNVLLERARFLCDGHQGCGRLVSRSIKLTECNNERLFYNTLQYRCFVPKADRTTIIYPVWITEPTMAYTAPAPKTTTTRKPPRITTSNTRTGDDNSWKNNKGLTIGLPLAILAAFLIILLIILLRRRCRCKKLSGVDPAWRALSKWPPKVVTPTLGPTYLTADGAEFQVPPVPSKKERKRRKKGKKSKEEQIRPQHDSVTFHSGIFGTNPDGRAFFPGTLPLGSSVFSLDTEQSGFNTERIRLYPEPSPAGSMILREGFDYGFRPESIRMFPVLVPVESLVPGPDPSPFNSEPVGLTAEIQRDPESMRRKAGTPKRDPEQDSIDLSGAAYSQMNEYDIISAPD